MKDVGYIRRALALAERGFTSPNPMVGCVIVKDNRIVGEGFHKRAGMPHAEGEALKKAGGKARGATMYVTLEPCCHFGRTPPCTDAVISAGISKVVAAMRDPNPIVAGKGFAALRKAGVRVKVGVLSDEAEKLNEAYIKRMKTGRPFVILKTAMSADGKISTKTGDSKWISSEESRKMVHVLRSRCDAVVVGANTVVVDDPRLTSRIRGGRNPLRVVVDDKLKSPLNAKFFADDNAIVATTSKANAKKKKALEKKGVRVLVLGKEEVDLRKLVRALTRTGATSVLIEGGGTLNASALNQKIVDKIMFFIAPKIIGGANAKTPVEGKGIIRVEKALRIKDITATQVGCDILIEGYLK